MNAPPPEPQISLMTTALDPSPAEIQARRDRLLSDIHAVTRQQVGYPVNQDFDYTPLRPLMQYSVNNVGDPFHPSNFRGNTHEIEREVIHRFAGLLRIAPADAWGYVISGGVEGNRYGLYPARELFPNAMFYFSEETHYSVLKNVRVLNARHIMIRRQDNGEIDYREERSNDRNRPGEPHHRDGGQRGRRHRRDYQGPGR